MAVGCQRKPEPTVFLDPFAGEWNLWTPFSQTPGYASFHGSQASWTYATDTVHTAKLRATYNGDEEAISLVKVSVNGHVADNRRFLAQWASPRLVYLTEKTSSGSLCMPFLRLVRGSTDSASSSFRLWLRTRPLGRLSRHPSSKRGLCHRQMRSNHG